ncbi:MAG TPA: glycosyltransferase family 39 protein [Actinomycetes bacterium]|nr:glycosyltransferase family 39 protein [Actinomycetes bacterium]
MFMVPLRRMAGADDNVAGLRVALAAHVVVRAFGLTLLYVAGLLNGDSAYHVLTRWDAAWYRRIAEHGYGHVHVASDGRRLSDYAFFPLYPMAERALSAVTGLPLVQAGLVISAISALMAAAGIYRVGTHLHDARTGVILVCLWSSVPVAVVQSMAYTESLFTAFVAWSLYAILVHRYVLAGALAALAGLTRAMSVALVAAVVSAALLGTGERSETPTRDPVDGRRSRLLGALLAPAGLVAYLAFVAWSKHRTLGYLDVASDWGNGIDGGHAFFAWLLQMLSDDRFLLGIALVLGLALLGAAVGHTASRGYPLPVFVFTLTAVLISMATSNYFGSRPRYLLPVFTLLLWPSEGLAQLANRRVGLVLACLAIGSGIYGAVWLNTAGPP